MLLNVKKYLMWSFYGLFSVCFIYLISHILIHNSVYGYQEIFIIPLILLSLIIFAFAFLKLKKYETWLEKYYIVIVAVFLGVMAILQLSFGVMLRFTPAFDLDAIYGGAIQWVQEGDFLNFKQYFQYFPNNLGGLTFLFIFFRIANLFGIHDFFLVAMVLNCLLSISTMLVTSAVCKKCFGVKYALFSLLLFSLSLPFYFIAPVFYTDALSMLFPILFYYLYLLAKDTEKLSKQIVLFILMGLTAGIGMELKFTVFIMVIAVFIEGLFHMKIKKNAIMIGITGAVIFTIFMSVNHVIYSSHLDKQEAKQINTPYLHWVMMGLKGSGTYNPEDYEFTRSFADTKERNQALMTEIKSRISGLGLNGMTELLTIKAERCFGDGTYALSDFLDDTPANDTFLHKYILYEGESNNSYRNLCEGVFMAILILMLFSGLQEIFSKEEKFRMFLAPRVGIFGVLLFLIFWETSGRYFSNFLPAIFFSAVMGIDYFTEKMKQLYNAMKEAFLLKADK